MPNQLSDEKEKITYAEFSEVREQLAKIAEDLSEQEGRTISEAELMRLITLDFANKNLRKQGKAELNVDPSSLPGGSPSVRRRLHKRAQAAA